MPQSTVSSSQAPESRPAEIDSILTSLLRYNPDNIKTFQDYVATQCSSGSYDGAANFALLKLYQFNPDQVRDETVVNILAKALTVFPAPDFSLALHLLPPSVLHTYPTASPSIAASAPSTVPLPPTAEQDYLTNSVHRLTYLNSLLELAAFPAFWRTLSSGADEEYVDLVAEVVGFDDEIRRGINNTIVLSMRSLKLETAMAWWNFSTREEVQTWIDAEMPGWTIHDDAVVQKAPETTSPQTPSTPATATATAPNGKVRFEQLSRIIRHVYETELIHH
ncbi:armadillo-type protein [Limtongia smithiae]|uniref:armadillo-type protein n=1 Tax=Limtongia smithiae TaxID=1125753 RepID=UPI0034CD94F8